MAAKPKPESNLRHSTFFKKLKKIEFQLLCSAQIWGSPSLDELNTNGALRRGVWHLPSLAAGQEPAWAVKFPHPTLGSNILISAAQQILSKPCFALGFGGCGFGFFTLVISAAVG